MFYVEVQLDPTGLLCDVKVAHHGENPVVCIIDKDEGNAFVFLELPFWLRLVWAEEMDYIECSARPSVAPLLLVLVESKSLRGVICSCGLIWLM